jgi:2-polyprenyl-3-methyl-5-hydroxy-6-metoxy-1,4-benzoquinol methylase
MTERLPHDLDAEAVVWDRWLAEHRVGVNARDPHALARISAVLHEVARLRLDAGARILEVGCGDGYDAVLLARLGRVTATDLAAETVAEAARRHAASGVEFVAGDFLSLAFPSAPFDVVVTLETIAHVHDQAAFVRRCADLLKPGGRLVVTTQNRSVYEYLGYGPAHGYVRRWLDRHELARLLVPGFRVERLRTIAPPDPGDVRPGADGGAPPPGLRLGLSYRLDQIASRLVPRRALQRARARAGLGRTLVAVARRT